MDNLLTGRSPLEKWTMVGYALRHRIGPFAMKETVSKVALGNSVGRGGKC